MNNHPSLAALALVSSLVVAWSAEAQYYFNGYQGGYHASTAAEGYQRGMADVIRSQGQRNLDNSQAAINLEAARSAAIDNRTKATNAYWERKQIYEENMAPIREAKHAEYQASRQRVKLKTLSPEQFDTTTGEISWPQLLQESEYDQFRQPLDQLFAEQGKYGVLKSDDYLQAKELIRQFRGAVTANKAKYPAVALDSSLRFLLKLNRILDQNLG